MIRAIIPAIVGLFLAAVASPAGAARVVDSVLLSFGAQTNVTSVTVPPNAVISARVTVTHTGTGAARRWFSTSWRIGGGAFTCVDHTQFTAAGTDSVTFNITAPAAAGTYNAEFIAWQAAGCTTSPSPTFTLTNGVIVSGVVDNSTVSASPTSVPADGWSTSTITVTIRDAANNPVAGKTVSLAALSGSSTISPPSGPSNASGVVTFSVSDAAAESVTYRATNVTDAVALTQTATVTFTALVGLSFNAVETGADAFTGKIFTKVAATTFKLDIVARNGMAVFTAFTGTVSVEIVDARSAGTCAAMTTILALPNQTFTLANKGRRNVGGTMPADAYPEARVRIGSPAAAPITVSCSSDAFAIRPSAFSGFSVTHGDWESPGVTALANTTFGAGSEIHKAGRPFTMSASAVNGAAKPAITSRYAGTPRAVLSPCGGKPPCTATFGTLNLGASFSAGQLASSAAIYSEVGAFSVQLVDDTFAAVDNFDGSTAAARNILSPTVNVGRFVPDHFAVTINAPSFSTACATGPFPFTYAGQRFAYAVRPVITVTARSFGGTPTTFYNGAWWRLTQTTLTPGLQNNRYLAAVGTLDVSGLPAVTGDPDIVATGGGSGTLTFNPNTGIAFTRSTHVAPFNADIAVTLNVIDSDGVAAAANPVTFGAATPGGGIAFTAGKEMRFGRLRLQNGHGSQLIAMPLALQAQYWNGTAFVLNTDDDCTAIAPANIALGNYRRNLAAGETTVSTSGTLNAGAGTVRLSAPGAANDGSVDVSINLTAPAAPGGASCTPGMPASTSTGFSYLQGAWCGAPYDDDPTARATFGVYRAGDRVIFQRENY